MQANERASDRATASPGSVDLPSSGDDEPKTIEHGLLPAICIAQLGGERLDQCTDAYAFFGCEIVPFLVCLRRDECVDRSTGCIVGHGCS